MNEITEFLNSLNISTIIPLIMSGGITVWFISQLKNIWSIIKNLFIQCISFTIHNSCIDERNSGGSHYSFTEKQQFFDLIITNAKTLWERTKNLDFTSSSSTEQYKRIKILFEGNTSENLTYGFSIKILFGKLIFCSRYIDNSSQKVVIKTDIRVFFASKQKFIDKINKKINALNDTYYKMDTLDDYTRVYSYGNTSIKNKRKMESIFTNNNEHIELYEDIEKFISNRELYKNLNYPYKYCALLYGVPGSGKTSTLLAIASKLNKHIIYVNLKRESINNIINSMCECSNDIFVFEDIDALKTDITNNRENGESESGSCDFSSKISSISLSELLNITDGLLSTDGIICLFTTNHIEKLDPALIRAGRMNKLVEFTYLNSETANRMIKNYLDIEIENLKDEIKPAELQEMILNIKVGKKTIDDLKQKFQNS